MTFEQKWIEYDFNPFIRFKANGKIISLNAEAQFLLNHTNASAIFNIATTYASQTFGFKTTFLDLEFGRYKFFGLTVGYDDEEEIAIKLYQTPLFKFTKPSIAHTQLVNIYTIIDLCISTNSINNNIDFIKQLDPSLPEVRINTNFFIQLLNYVYQTFLDNSQITTKLFLKVGEHIKFEDKKYPLFCVCISADKQAQIDINKINYLSTEANLYTTVHNHAVSINIPLISQ